MNDLAGWAPLDWTPPAAVSVRYAVLERLGPAHIDALHAANPKDATHWAYMPYDPSRMRRSTVFGRMARRQATIRPSMPSRGRRAGAGWHR